MLAAVASLACGCSGRSGAQDVRLSPPPPPSPPPRPARGNSASSLVRLGDDMRRSGDVDGALAFYRSAIAREPANGEALEHMGALWNETHDPERAEQSFRAALVVDPGNRRALRGLAVALLSEHRAAEALPILRRLASGSSDPQILRDYGVALDLTGHPGEAQAVYRFALTKAPADAALHGDLALSLAVSGNLAEAMEEARAAVGSPLPDPRQDANSVLVFALAGREAQARDYGAGLSPGRMDALLARARVARDLPDAGQRAAVLGLVTGPQP